MHPGCTIEPLSLRPRQLRELSPFGPPNFLQFLPSFGGQMFVYRHQVVRLPARFREPPLQKLVEGLQVFQPPVLPSSYFAEISAELYEFCIAFRFVALLPGEDLIDLRQHEQCAFSIKLRQHGRIPSTQARQANQVALLRDASPRQLRPTPAAQGIAQHTGRYCMDSAEIGFRCGAGTAPIRSGGPCLRRAG